MVLTGGQCCDGAHLCEDVRNGDCRDLPLPTTNLALERGTMRPGLVRSVLRVAAQGHTIVIGSTTTWTPITELVSIAC